MSGLTESERMAEIAAQIAVNPIDRSVEKFQVSNIGRDDDDQFRVVVKCARFDNYLDAQIAGKVIAKMIKGEWP